jgi:hypothetical protein
MNLLKWVTHAYQCTLWLPTENALQNYIWWLQVQVQNRYVHLSWVADPTIKNTCIEGRLIGVCDNPVTPSLEVAIR